MSYVGAIPVDSSIGAVSESHLPIIDAALASVRKNAGLDEEKVLPPLEVLAPKPPPFRVMMTESVHQLPSAEAIVRTCASSASVATVTSENERNKQTARTRRSFAQKLRWPVLLCGFVGGIFGGVAVVKSPIGDKPAVRSVVVKAESSISKIFFAAKTRASR